MPQKSPSWGMMTEEIAKRKKLAISMGVGICMDYSRNTTAASLSRFVG